jgi:hypothetical protein
VPEAEEPIPESGRESRLEANEGEGLRELDCGTVRTVGGLVELVGDVNFFSKAEVVRLGTGSSSGTMTLCVLLGGG